MKKQEKNTKSAASSKPNRVKKETRKKPATLAELAALYNVTGLEKITSWKALYNEKGNISLPVPEMTEEEIFDYDSPEEAMQALMDRRKRAASVIFNLFEALLAAHGESAEYKKQLASWAGGEVIGYTQGNPARLTAQFCAWGIDSTAPGFTLDTPKNWDKRGYSLKETARPLFVITPLFTPEDVEKAEQSGETVLDYSEPAEGSTEAKKAQKKRYSIHALYAPEDVDKVRDIKRRPVKKSEKADRAEAMRAEAEKAPARKPKKAKAEPVYMANDEYAQLALGL